MTYSRSHSQLGDAEPALAFNCLIPIFIQFIAFYGLKILLKLLKIWNSK